eukprot:289558-Rhodomonas_salina.5
MHDEDRGKTCPHSKTRSHHKKSGADGAVGVAGLLPVQDEGSEEAHAAGDRSPHCEAPETDSQREGGRERERETERERERDSDCQAPGVKRGGEGGAGRRRGEGGEVGRDSIKRWRKRESRERGREADTHRDTLRRAERENARARERESVCTELARACAGVGHDAGPLDPQQDGRPGPHPRSLPYAHPTPPPLLTYSVVPYLPAHTRRQLRCSRRGVRTR